MTGISNLTPDALVLATKNTGALYQRHLQLAREDAVLQVWIRHVKGVALPAYRKDFHEPNARLTPNDIIKAAMELQRYYRQHVSEF